MKAFGESLFNMTNFYLIKGRQSKKKKVPTNAKIFTPINLFPLIDK